MKKFLCMAMAGAFFTLSACADNSNMEADYSYESQAPYGDERTVGGSEDRGDRLFRSRQLK